jgi:hypothetical protein
VIRTSYGGGEADAFVSRYDKALNHLAGELRLPKLRVLVCYSVDDRLGTRPLPLHFGTSALFQPLASTLEELAVVEVADFSGASALVFPRLRRLHARVFPFFDPKNPPPFAHTFPALEEVVFSGGGVMGSCMDGLPFAALPLLPRLRTVSISKLCSDGDGFYSHLARCCELTSLRLHGVAGAGLDDVVPAARAPRLRHISLEGCIFDGLHWLPSQLREPLLAAAGPSRTLNISVGDGRGPAPCGLLPDGYGRGEWWHADATPC